MDNVPDFYATDDVQEVPLVFAAIVQAVSTFLGRPSRWTGDIGLTDNPFVSGIAHLDGRVEITLLVWSQPEYRWRTLIHEALHLFSPAYTKQEYVLARGWEEGVVEQLQRLLRQKVFAALNVTIAEEIFVDRDASHEYNRYIRALESLRDLLDKDALEFYLWLLAIPLSERLRAVEAKGDVMQGTQRTQFRRALMLAQGILGRT